MIKCFLHKIFQVILPLRCSEKMFRVTSELCPNNKKSLFQMDTKLKSPLITKTVDSFVRSDDIRNTNQFCPNFKLTRSQIKNNLITNVINKTVNSCKSCGRSDHIRVTSKFHFHIIHISISLILYINFLYN